MVSFFSFCFLCLSFSHLLSQSEKNFAVRGRVLDELNKHPLDYATVQLMHGDRLVDGGLTDHQGYFNLKANGDSLVLQVDYMGYISSRIQLVSLQKVRSMYDLGDILLKTHVSNLGEVLIEAEQSSMQLALDKKIFNVGKDLANAGGSASDVLTNIPSVSVDPEGAVKLRGSDNVRILIDGKPSGLVSIKGGAGLQQLQANMIERVEIITNPSARYEAEGMAGIINIILKKDRSQGFNGSIDIIGGNPLNTGLATNFNYRHKKVNFFVNYGVTYRDQPGISSLNQQVFNADTTYLLKQNNTASLQGFNNNARAGLDFFMTEKDVLTASYINRRLLSKRITNLNYEDYIFSYSGLFQRSHRMQDEKETEPNSEYSLIYKKNFAKKNQELTSEIKYLDYWENSDQVFTQEFFSPSGVQDLSRNLVQSSINDEFEKQWLFQLDYTQPIYKEGKFETGLRSSFRNMINDFVVNQKQIDGSLKPLPGLDNIFEYDENIHAAYVILGNKSKNFSYQFGLRTEYTDVKTTLIETSEVNPRDYFNLFPSAHFTYELPKENAVQWSYSRRVRRPFYNDLSPFSTFSDARNFFSGNPNLNPEFTDLFEVGHLKYLEKGSFSSSFYYRSTTGKIERIRRVDLTGFSTTQPENLLSEHAWGLDLAGGYNLAKWWKLDLNFNAFFAQIDGSNILEDYKTETYSWFARQTSRFSLPHKLDIQLRANYEAPQKTAQGRRKSLFFSDLSVSKDILKSNGTLTLNILDVFNSRKFRGVFKGPNFITESVNQMRRRQINLTFSYRIKQSKTTRTKKIELEQ